jgi:hypothetical protein
LTLIAAWQVHRGRTVAASILGIGAILTSMCLFRASLTLRFYRWWMEFASVLGWINSRVLLSLIYWVVISPLGIAMRLVGQDPLDRRHGPRSSYWNIRPKRRQNREDFEKAF